MRTQRGLRLAVTLWLFREPFDGSSARIEAGDDSLTATDSRTACGWDVSHSYHWRSTRSLLLDRPVFARPVVNEAVSVLALDCLVSTDE